MIWKWKSEKKVLNPRKSRKSAPLQQHDVITKFGIRHHQPPSFLDTDNYTKISTSQNFNFTPLQKFWTISFDSHFGIFFFLPLFHLILTSRQKVENSERDGEKNQGSWNIEIGEIVPRVIQVYISIALSRQVIEYIIEFYNIESSQGKNSA